MDREAHNELMSSAKFKPGDVVWQFHVEVLRTNVKTYSPWPGKVLQVSDEILKIYPHETEINQYVELYMKKEKKFLPEDQLWAFDEGQAEFSLRKRTPLFHQAVFAARKQALSAELELSENSIMDIENTGSICSGSNLPTKAQLSETFHPHSYNSDVGDFEMPVLKPCVPLRLLRHSRPSSKVDVPSKKHFKKKSKLGKKKNKDSNSQAIYEFSKSGPLALDIEKPILEDESAMETSIIKTSPVDIKKKISNSHQISESSRSSRRMSIRRKVPKVETTLDAEENIKCEILNDKNIDRITPQVKPIFESRLNTQPAPFCISVNAKIPEVKKTAAKSRGRKSRKRQHVKKSDCDQTVEEEISDDEPDKLLKLHYLETKTELNDLPNGETKVLDQPDENTNSNDEVVEEQPETSTQQKSDDVMLTQAILPLDPNQNVSIGFLGLGALGKRIVKQLLDDGHDVTVWNRSFYKCYDMVDVGAKSKSTAEQVVDSCDVTFICVTDSAAVQQVFFSPTGALKGIREGKNFVVLTTIEPDLSSAIEFVVKTKGGLYLEAPMFPAGGTIVDNALMAVIGGNRTCLNICIPLFRSFIKDLVYIGNVPDANKMVLVMKSLSAVKIAALAEGMALADRCDVPTDVLLQIFKQSDMASPFLISKAEAMLQCKPWCKDDIFPLSQFSTDLTSTLQLSSDLRTPVIAATKQVFIHSKLRGYSHHDVSAVYFKYSEPF